MQVQAQVDIDLPWQRVVELFDDRDNLFRWQDGLQSFEHLSGEPGQVGAQSKLVYRQGKRDFELIETITERRLPEAFNGTYTHKGVHNEVRNRFVELGPDKTRWECENAFRFSGFMRLMAPFIRGAIAKKTQHDLNAFKQFAEGTANQSSSS